MTFYLKVGNHVIGKKHLQALPYWLPSVMAYGATAVVGFCWFCDFKAVMGKVPFYRNRFAYPYEDDKRIYVEPRYKI